MEFSEHLRSPLDLYELYRRLGWAQFLQLSAEQLARAMAGSWYVLYVYDGDRLIGTGRVVSDGVINAYLCGLGVDPEYRRQGIGSRIMALLVERCEQRKLHVQFFCEESLVSFYQQRGYEVFAVGMKKNSSPPELREAEERRP